MSPPPLDLRLIVITDAALAEPRSIAEVVHRALAAGTPAVQLRDKNATASQLYQQALRLRDLTSDYLALLFINDRLDVALAAGADGVHLGPHDLPVAAARAAASRAGRDNLLIGTSTDDPDRARQAARDGADYIGCGAVFGTTSKSELGDERIGTRRLAQVVESVQIPVVGIGGIDHDNIQEVARTGAAGAAVISAVMGARNLEDVVRSLLDTW